MNLDPTASPVVQVLAATAACAWIVAIGAPLSQAVFGHRPRRAWPLYAPIVGLAAVLLTTNLTAYVAPGALSAWLGLLVPSGLAAVVAWRGRAFADPFWRSPVRLALLGLPAAAAFLWILANYTHMTFGDAHWHLALVQQLARGGVPVVTPYGVDSGISYHYGTYLLAATVVHAAAVPAWTALAVVVSFLVVALVLTALGFAWDVGAPLPLAIGAGAAIGVFAGSVDIGLPPYVTAAEPSEGLAGLLAGLVLNPADSAFSWPVFPGRAFALGLVVLLAAALEAGTDRRQAVVLAASAGILALAEASVMVFASAALGTVVIARLGKLPGHRRLSLVAALTTAALLILLAGGPLSDAVFGRGGTTGLTRIAFEPDWADLLPFEVAGPLLVRVGIIPLTLFAALVALRRRSWGLALLAATGVFALVESVLVHSSNPIDDARILYSASAIGLLVLLAGLGCLASGWRGGKRVAAVLAVLVLAVLPTVLPRAVPGARLALEGFRAGRVSTDGSDYPFVGRSLLHGELIQNWDFYRWLNRSLPLEARLLTTHPSAVASIAGVPSPTSGRDMQLLSPWVTPVYEDAIRFLHRDDLRSMGITHLHVTDALAKALTPQARHLLDDPAHFRLLADLRSVAGLRHRVFAVMPGAGTRDVAPTSYHRLRDVVPRDAPLVLLDGLTVPQRRMLLYTFIDQEELQAQTTYVTRVTRRPSFSPVSHLPQQGADVYVALAERIDPLSLGLARDDAIWAGHGMRVYHMASTWTPVFRIDAESAEPNEHIRSTCELAESGLRLRLLGDPGDRVVAGSATVELAGTPQVIDLGRPDCGKLSVFASRSPDRHAPVAQIRPRLPGVSSGLPNLAAGLVVDGVVEADKATVSLWYGNPHQLLFAAETEFRLYRVNQRGTNVANLATNESVRWWSGPLNLTAESQASRIEFDAQTMQIDGDRGLGLSNQIIPGKTYVLTLNVSVRDPQSRNVVIQQQIPILKTRIGEADASISVFSGIASVEHRAEGAAGLVYKRHDDGDRHLDFTP